MTDPERMGPPYHDHYGLISEDWRNIQRVLGNSLQTRMNAIERLEANWSYENRRESMDALKVIRNLEDRGTYIGMSNRDQVQEALRRDIQNRDYRKDLPIGITPSMMDPFTGFLRQDIPYLSRRDEEAINNVFRINDEINKAASEISGTPTETTETDQTKLIKAAIPNPSDEVIPTNTMIAAVDKSTSNKIIDSGLLLLEEEFKQLPLSYGINMSPRQTEAYEKNVKEYLKSITEWVLQDVKLSDDQSVMILDAITARGAITQRGEEDISDFTYMRDILSDPEKAMEALKERGLDINHEDLSDRDKWDLLFNLPRLLQSDKQWTMEEYQQLQEETKGRWDTVDGALLKTHINQSLLNNLIADLHNKIIEEMVLSIPPEDIIEEYKRAASAVTTRNELIRFNGISWPWERAVYAFDGEIFTAGERAPELPFTVEQLSNMRSGGQLDEREAYALLANVDQVSYRNEMLKRSAVSLFRGAVDAYMPNFTEDHGIIDWTSFAEFNLNPQEHNLTVPQQNHIDKVLKLVNGYLGDELSERDAVAEATTMSVRIAGWNEALDNGERTAPGDSNDNIFNLFFGNTNLSKEIRNGNHDAIETWNRGVSIVSSLYTKYLRMLLDDEEIPLQYIPVDQRDIDGAPLQVDWSDLAPHERLATMLTVLELRRSYIEDGTTHLEVGFREWIDVGLDNFTPELLNSETPDVGKISSVEGVLSFLNYLKGSSGSSRNADDIREATGMSDRAWDTIQLILGSGILESFTKPGIAAQLQPPPENLSPDALVEYQNNLRGIFMELRNAFTDTERMLATLLQNVRSSSTSLSINTLTEKQDTALRYLSQANSFKELETQASENPNSSDGTKLTYRLRIRKMLEDGGWIIPEDKKEARIALENLLPGEGEGKYVGIYEEIRDEDTKEAYMAGVYHRLGFLASFQRTEEGSVPIRNQVEIMISLPKMSQTSNYSLMEFGTMFNHIPGISTGSSRIPMLVGGEEIRLSKGNAHAINTIGGPRSDDDLEDYGNSIDAIANGRSFLQTPVMGLIEGERPWAGGRMGGRYFTGPRNEFDRLERIILASIDTGHDEIQRLTSSGASIQSLVSQVVSDYKIFFEQREELIRLTEKDFQSNVEYMLETNPAFSNNPNQASQTLRKDIEMLKNSRIELKDIIYEVLYRLSESSEESFSLFDRASFYRSPFLSSLNADIPIRYFGIYGRSEDDSLDRFPSLIRHSGGGRQGSPLDLKFHLDPNSPPVSLPFIRVFLDTSPHGGGSEWERGSESPGSRFESAIQQGLYLQADIGAQ